MTYFNRAASFAALSLVALPLAAGQPALAQAADAKTAAAAVVDITNPMPRAKTQLEAQLVAMRKGEMLRAMFNQNPSFRALAQQKPAEVDATLARAGAIQADALGPIQREMLAASRQTAIDIWARDFTVAEMNAIAAFYKSPAGAKMLARQPAVNAEVAKTMQTRFGPRVQAAEKAAGPKIDAELRKLGPQQAPAK